MSIVVLYLATAVTFLVLDSVMLGRVIGPLFRRHLGEQLLAEPRMAVAAVFYLFYVAGLVWLVSLPALEAGQPGQALLDGAILGAVAYGTYEFTSYAVMRDWHPRMVATDLAWGTALTAVSAWVGVVVTGLVFG
ncbi:MAG: DUF2177 family protein [Pseudomonadota bacterium]